MKQKILLNGKKVNVVFLHFCLKPILKVQIRCHHFFIFKKHKFLKNIFLEEELSKTENLENIEIFHE